MRPIQGNLFGMLPPPSKRAGIEVLATGPGLTVERIVWHGHASAPGSWV